MGSQLSLAIYFVVETALFAPTVTIFYHLVRGTRVVTNVFLRIPDQYLFLDRKSVV